MSRYTGPKGRVNRRIGMLIYENGGASRAMERRGNQPPGMHTRARRPSNYGKALS
ncbi:MAG: 30S ribosomal protein S4, partial [Planctomycetota bacterium]